MKKIPSFTIDHIRLERGIYVSRQDNVGDEVVTTFDVRMKEPNREPVLSPSAIHTCATTPCGPTESSTGGLWAVSQATISL